MEDIKKENKSENESVSAEPVLSEERTEVEAAVPAEPLISPEPALEEKAAEKVEAHLEAPLEAPAEPAKPPADKKWYIIHTYSGYENKVRANLLRRIESMGMKDKIFQVLVPMEEEIEFRDGKRRTVQKKIYPGYVLIEMVMTDDSWYVVRNTSGVTGFVGPGVKPVPLAGEEVKQILRTMGMEAPVKKKIDIEKKQGVRVTHGPFQDFTGIVEEVNPEKEKIRVLITIFGRETPVELDFGQIEKL